MGRKKASKRKAGNVTAEKISLTAANKKNNKIAAEDEVVVLDDDDELDESSSGEKILSRSSSSRFSSVMGELMPILGDRQKTRISETPLAKWVDMPVLAPISGRIGHLLSRFDASSCSFVLSPDVSVPFRSSDFSAVLGLRHSGPPVDIYLRRPSAFLSRHFSGKASAATLLRIRQKMRSLAGSDDEGEIDDFVRFFILLAFNYVVFPTGNSVTPGFVFSYLDDLTTFFDRAWGDAAFQFLHREMCDLGRKRYVDGCVVGLMALVYESVPTLGVDRGLKLCPRLFRWADSNIPLDSAEAECLLKSIDPTQVLSIRPSHEEEEEELLGREPPGLIPEEEASKVGRLQDAVIRLMDETKALRRKCAELEETTRLQDVVIRQMGEITALKRKCAELVDRNSRSGSDEEVVEVVDRASKRRWPNK